MPSTIHRTPRFSRLTLIVSATALFALPMILAAGEAVRLSEPVAVTPAHSVATTVPTQSYVATPVGDNDPYIFMLVVFVAIILLILALV